jgi:hypothetical protein
MMHGDGKSDSAIVAAKPANRHVANAHSVGVSTRIDIAATVVTGAASFVSDYSVPYIVMQPQPPFNPLASTAMGT